MVIGREPVLTRRRMLGAGAAIAATAIVGGCARSERTQVPTSPPRSGSDVGFAEPVSLRSEGGQLSVRLVAGRSPEHEGLLSYNDGAVGPTWRVRPGDVVTVDLVNELGEPTNLHTHGLLVSPTGAGDNVFATVEAGEMRRYRYEIPADHPIGTFWYHPHVHGSVARQTAAGLVGAIVVEPSDPHPVVGAVPERVFVLHDPVAVDRSVSHMDQMHGRTGGAVLVNGVSRPAIELPVGATEQWRFVNASASRRLPVGIDGREVALIGLDGDVLAAPVTVGGLMLSPGERLDIVVTIDEVGVRGIGDDGTGSSIAMLHGVESAQRPRAVDLPATLSDRARSAGDVTTRRTLRFGSGGAMMGDLEFTIDGRTFDPDRVDISTTLGAVEAWTIVNDTMIDHPFHLHVWPFLVDGGPLGPIWKDTVNVPGGSSVTVTIPFGARPGRTVFHCHVLDHEDLGMMGVIDVA